MELFHIVFRYKDAWSRGKWNTQECTLSSVKECIKLYGLGEDGCEYQIVSVTPVNSNKDKENENS